MVGEEGRVHLAASFPGDAYAASRGNPPELSERKRSPEVTCLRVQGLYIYAF